MTEGTEVKVAELRAEAVRLGASFPCGAAAATREADAIEAIKAVDAAAAAVVDRFGGSLRNKEVERLTAYLDSCLATSTVGAPPAVEERMDKIPARALLWVGRVMGEGMKYENEEAGTDDWQSRPAAYHLNRMLRHVAQHLSGDTSEDHVGHVMTRALMWGHQIKALDADSAD